MSTTDIIIIVILCVIVASALFYMRKKKKSGQKCIGCPYAGNCAHSCSHPQEKSSTHRSEHGE